MKCWICNSEARVVVETTFNETFYVCGVCDEVGVFCDKCERPINDSEPRYEHVEPYRHVTCDPCEEEVFAQWSESRVF